MIANARLAVFDSLNADDVFIAVPLVGLKLGALTRTRTADLLLTKQLLYQLSYKGLTRLLQNQLPCGRCDYYISCLDDYSFYFVQSDVESYTLQTHRRNGWH